MADEAAANFAAITGSSLSVAQQYLRLGDNDLEQAVGLYYANEGAELEVTGAASHGPPTSTSPPRRPAQHPVDEQGVVHVDSDEEDHSQPTGTPQPSGGGHGGTAANGSMEDDEAMARRLQEEFYDGAQAIYGSGADPVGDDGYRAPIARTTQTLVGADSYDPNDPDDVRAAVMEQMMARRQPRPRDRPGIFNQDPQGRVWNQPTSSTANQRDLLSRATGGASESSSKATSLAEMYRPPFELISRLPWDDAREEGKATEKWIIVNIQDPSIFDCQVLNRDLWKHPGIMETIRESFIFMQYSKDNPLGNQYIQYYFQNKDHDDAYPHIAIVDPRTGEQVKVWSGPPAPKAMDFLMQLHEFLDRYSLKASAKNPVAKRKPPPRKETQVDRMTEEQQMEMALQASMAGSRQEEQVGDPDDLTRSIGTLDPVLASHEPEALNEPHNDPHASDSARGAHSAFQSISSSSFHTEPDANPSTTSRIQFRHPDGRVVRRFALTDPVRRIYEWLKSDPIEGKAGLGFELISMQKNLMTMLDDTIADAGLRNGTVMVEFNEAT